MASLDIGIDLGTTSIIVYMHGRGIILREPSVVAVDTRSKMCIRDRLNAVCLIHFNHHSLLNLLL